METSLPISKVIPELRQTLQARTTAILSAPTGSGKTTALPIALMEESWLQGKKIILLEPRRLAARLAATFMAAGLGEEVGERVGYQVRFDRRISAATRIEVITNGLFIRRLQDDPELGDVGLVIFDEFHERSLEGDLALALCLEIQQELRADLRLLVMSATLAEESLADLLTKAPVITGQGRSFPVENRYLPSPPELDSPRPDHIARMTARGIRYALAEESGDMLVFLPGRGEINRVMDLLTPQVGDNILVQPLHGGMKLQDQARAVRSDPDNRQRIILSTTIAETSLTIEGITTVVDCGWKRAPRFDAASGLTRLETVRIAKASARQRSGRAGRLGPGVCYRLWHRGVEQGLQPFDRPEILQADLAPLVLELALWGENDPTRLRWLDPPGEIPLQQARQLLMDLEAIDTRGHITKAGRAMAALPIHPRLSHMLLAAEGKDNRAFACDIAALASERDILRGRDIPVDLEERLHVLSRFRRHGSRMTNIDLPACRQVERVRQQLARLLPRQSGKNSELLSAGALLSLAYPDRIAGLRPGSSLSYKLVSGRGAVLPAHDRLQSTPFLAIAAMDGRRAEGLIYLAASLTKEELQALHDHRIVPEETVAFDPDCRAVRGSVITRIGKMEIARRPLKKPDPLLVQEALLAAIRQEGLNTLPMNKQTINLVRRIRLLAKFEQEESWPDFSDKALLTTLEDWLAPYLTGIKSMAGLQRLNLGEIFLARLDWRQQQQLKRETPTHLRVPSGSRVGLQYQEDGPPILAVRLQEMFGLETTPTICRGRVRVLLHLLSPARRPMQITDDLKGFWENSYHEIKKELKGRYPKHYWPDDPLNAEATARVKRKRN